ncbi:4-hydroxyphenylpyruvate [Tolypocladium paradoxum]|uniref:4-hydroxyphenylpyruvate n=1 Tax=Tolypocladium paradoxum TaxID=94208 RepID=A0A2S4KMI4_9HYPO|nr:4-hydroxyphenylpyruvate [Tolypocladium paradoxum]
MERAKSPSLRSTPDLMAARRSKRARAEADRDDSDETAIARPRVRVTRACNECRKRKDRCDGQWPTCRSCLGAGRLCSYNPSKKRGLRTGYVRALETLLGLIFSTVEGSEQWLSDFLEEKGTRSTLYFKVTASLTGRDSVDSLLGAWRGSAISTQIEQLLSQSESVEDDEDGESTNTFDGRVVRALCLVTTGRGEQEAGHLNNLDGALEHPLSPINTDCTPPAPAASRSPKPATVSHADLQPVIDRVSAEAASPMASMTLCSCAKAALQPPGHTVPVKRNLGQLPPNWSRLLDHYFAHAHCWFPISQKHDLLRTSYLLANEGSGPEPPEALPRGDVAFLWAVLAYSSHETDGENTLHDQNLSGQGLSQAFYAKAMDLVADEHAGLELGHVRALLVLALLQVHRGKHLAAWLAVGRAVYAASSLNILPCKSRSTPAHHNEGTRRTLLGCFALDALMASQLGTRPYYQHSDIAAIGLLPTDGMEEWEPWCPSTQSDKASPNSHLRPRQAPGHILSTFNHFIELTGLLNDLLRLSQEGPQEDRLQALGTSLRNWKQRLPLQLACEVDAPPQILNLHLASNGVSEALRVEGLRLTGKDPDFGVTNTLSCLQPLIGLLEWRIQSQGVYSIPLAVEAYMSSFNQSLDLQVRLHGDSGVKEQFLGLQHSLSELARMRRDTRSSGASSKHDCQIPPAPSDAMMPGGFPFNTPESTRFDAYMASAAPMISGPPPLNQRTSIPLFGDPDLPPTTDTSMLQQAPQLNLGAATDNTAAPPYVAPDTNCGSRMDSIAIDVDEGLFDSLATLDSADW